MRTLITLALLCGTVIGSSQTLELVPVFGTGGIVTADVAAQEDNLKSHALMPDGRLILAGDGYDLGTNSIHITMVAIDPVCGALDPGFGSAGTMSHIFEQRTRCASIAAQPDGKIVGCGMIAPSNFGSEQWPGVYRFHGDGAVDTSFNHTGYHRLQFGAGAADFNKVFVDPNGTITCAVASFPGQLGAMRFLENGALDTTFNQTGITAVQLPNFALSGLGCGVMLPDGSVISIVTGFNGVDYMLMLAKFDDEGTPDPAFGVNGLVVGTVPMSASGRLGAAVEPSGAILVSGMRTSSDIAVVARFLSDGSPDPGFGTGGYSEITNTGGVGNGVALLPDGSTVQFGRVNNLGGLAKRDANGQLVASFGAGGLLGVSAGLPGIQVFTGGGPLPDGRIIAYGDQDINTAYIAKLTEDPVADGLPVISLIGSDLVTTGGGDIQWYLDGSPISGANGMTHTPLVNGSYTVTLTLSPNCIFTSDPYIMLSAGVEEQLSDGMHVLNNPANEVLSIMNGARSTPYRLIDHHGRIVASGLLGPGLNEVGLRGMASGVYHLLTPAMSTGTRVVVR